MDQDKINNLIREVVVAWENATGFLEELSAYPSAAVEANDWLATVILRVAELNAAVANRITTAVR